jgi:uncharacterized protein involved in exopolysaccharide biosynthesis
MDGDSFPGRRVRFYTLRDAAAALFRQSRVAMVCMAVLSLCVLAAVWLAPKIYEGELTILMKRDRAESVVSAGSGTEAAVRSDVSEQELLSEVQLIQGYDLLAQVARDAGLVERLPDGAGARERDAALGRAVRDLRGDLAVEPIKRTWMIDVTYGSPDPQVAQKVLDSLSRLYLEKHLAVRRPPGAHEFFTQQATQSLDDLRKAETALQEFGKRNRLVSAASEKETALQKLSEFQALQRQAEAELAETTRRVSSLEQERRRTPMQRTAQLRTSDPAGLMQETQTRIMSLESKRTELLQKFTPGYRAVVELDEQLAQARRALETARQQPVKEETIAHNPTMQWLENEIARGRTERAALQARVKSLRGISGDYRSRAQHLDVDDAEQRALFRTLKSAEDKYLLYQRKQEEARISDALDRTRIANVAIAQAPTVPFEPRRTRGLSWLAVGLLLSAALSIVAALVADALTSKIQTPADLETAVDLPVLAWIPASRR